MNRYKLVIFLFFFVTALVAVYFRINGIFSYVTSKKSITKDITVTNASTVVFSINQKTLFDYYAEFSKEKFDSVIQDADKINIVFDTKKPPKSSVFFSIPPDPNNAYISYGRENNDREVTLYVYIDENTLSSSSDSDAKKIIELQILQALYIANHPKILNSASMVQDVYTEVSKYQPEVGSILKQ